MEKVKHLYSKWSTNVEKNTNTRKRYKRSWHKNVRSANKNVIKEYYATIK